MPKYDVVIVGSGPNGLAAAVALAREGLSTLVVEGHELPGGGTRTTELTAPGFVHDVCSSVHPLGVASPAFRELGIMDDIEWVHPDAALAHVIDEHRVVTLERSIDDTAAQLGVDGKAYRDLLAPFVERAAELFDMILGPLSFPKAPLLMAKFGNDALRSMKGLAHVRFDADEAPALLAGIAAHAMVPLEQLATASFGLVLAIAGHAAGWPIARGGSRTITNALVTKHASLGGELTLGRYVENIDELPPARAYMFDVTPRQLVQIAGHRLPTHYRDRLAKFRYGTGVFKMDWALRGPVPWRDRRCARSATVHLSGTWDQVAAAERAVHEGRVPEMPFTLFVQPTLFDSSRAPDGMHIAWAYCHAPAATAVDATEAIESHIERYAPGFRDLIIARHTMNPIELAAYNPNYVGGDINGGLADVRQLFFRPMPKLDPYATGAPDIFLCSSSTPPGGGVHGMCGYFAAKSVLWRVFKSRAA